MWLKAKNMAIEAQKQVNGEKYLILDMRIALCVVQRWRVKKNDNK